MLKSDYLPHVDGLRAIAVIAVVLFHLDIEFVKSGYIGVDIFFVISGYLITHLIVKNHTENRFSFATFYVRRARRLFPALFVTCAVTLAFGFLILSASDYQNTGAQVLHSLLSISNFWFWNNSGYFATEAKLLPLLHTWSLSVEEQFYLIWPPLLVFAVLKLKQKLQLFAIFALFVTSLIAALAFFQRAPDAVFYLMPFRVFEFCVGAALVWLPKYHINKLASEVITLSGIGLILIALLAFSSNAQINPAYLLIPSIGTAVIIYFGNTATSKLLLANQMMVGIGKISYSLYLIHWPIIVFAYYYKLEALTNLEKLLILFVSIVLSVLSYYFVEQPFRNPSKNKKQFTPPAFGLACAACVGLLAYPASSAWGTGGYEWRVPKLRPSLRLVHEIVENTSPEQHAMSAGKGFPRVVGYGSKSEGAKRGILIGDSHAGQYRDMIDYLGKTHNINFTLSEFPGCPPVFGTYKIYGVATAAAKQERCKIQIQHWQKLLEEQKFDYVLLSSRWSWLYEETQYGEYEYRRDYLVDINNPVEDTEVSRAVFKQKLSETVKEITSYGSQVILFSQVPNTGKNIKDCNNVPRYLFSRDAVNRRCVGVTKKEALERLSYTDQTIQQIGKIEGVTSVLPSKYFCLKKSSHCSIVGNNTLLYLDDDHINQYGAIYFAKRWENQKSFPFK